jgi:hypothetical protein
MGKGGGTQVVKNELPEWLRPHVEGNIDRAQQISNIGYVPYSGPDVAAFTPMQTDAMRNTNQMARAFGMNAQKVGAGMPKSQRFAGGVHGHSSLPLFNQSVRHVKQNRRGQFDAIMGQFINPRTGAAPAAGPWGPQPGAGAAGGQEEEKIPNGYGKDVHGNIVPNWKLER